jgi:hypothetical protein
VKLIVKDTPGLDGEYDADFDFAALTNNELRVIKRLSGVRAGELQEALKAGDNDVLVAFSVVWLTRAGKDPAMAEQLLWDAPVGALDLDTTEAGDVVEADARPPDSPTASGNEKELDALSGSSEPGESSSSGLSNGSALLENGRSRTGSPSLDTGVISDPVISAN